MDDLGEKKKNKQKSLNSGQGLLNDSNLSLDLDTKENSPQQQAKQATKKKRETEEAEDSSLDLGLDMTKNTQKKDHPKDSLELDSEPKVEEKTVVVPKVETETITKTVYVTVDENGNPIKDEDGEKNAKEKTSITSGDLDLSSFKDDESLSLDNLNEHKSSKPSSEDGKLGDVDPSWMASIPYNPLKSNRMIEED